MKIIRIVVVVVVLVALFIWAAQPAHYDGDDLQMNAGTGGDRPRTVVADVPHVKANSQTSNAKAKQETPETSDADNGSGDHDAASSVVAPAPLLQADDGQRISSQPAQAPKSAGTVLDRSTVMSDSIRALCERETDPASPWNCKMLDDALARMEPQPRSEPWASQMESKFLQYVASQEGEYTIRTLECRTSLCVIEAASPNGLLLDPNYKWSVENAMKTIDRIWAYERGDAGERITVTFSIYSRK